VKFYLENSPWAVALVVALGCLVLMTLVLTVAVALGAKIAAGPLLAGMGVWSGIVGTALTVGARRAAKRNGADSDDDDVAK
jgi:hypothetical protein